MRNICNFQALITAILRVEEGRQCAVLHPSCGPTCTESQMLHQCPHLRDGRLRVLLDSSKSQSVENERSQCPLAVNHVNDQTLVQESHFARSPGTTACNVTRRIQPLSARFRTSLIVPYLAPRGLQVLILACIHSSGINGRVVLSTDKSNLLHVLPWQVSHDSEH